MSQIRTTIPMEETPAGTCEHCGHPFPTSERLVLHKGIEHPSQLDDSEQEAFESAVTEEEADLRTLRLKALAVLVLLYFGLLILYAIFA
ncbi:DNA-binding protein [Haloarcula sp. 1CSR25-25]|nr:DNA-binding protein [Haloarcula sp. 1CSR25-25]